MIYFLKHSDWILYNSIKEISDSLIKQYDYKVNAISPDREYKNKFDKYFSEIHLWDVDRFKFIDIKGIINLKAILKNLNEEDIDFIILSIYYILSSQHVSETCLKPCVVSRFKLCLNRFKQI